MKPIRYALLQQTLEIPDVNLLKQAFTAVRCLVGSDAYGLANDAFGILVRNLEAEDAHRLHEALRKVGVDTELLAMQLLPAVPPTKHVHRIEFGPDALLIYDPIGRPVPIEWRHVMMIAAGNVLVSGLTRRTVTGSPPDLLMSPRSVLFGGLMASEPVGAKRSVMREEQHRELTLDLVLTNGLARFSLEAKHASAVVFKCLGERRTRRLEDDFRLLVGELARAAPKALMNRGAWFLLQSPPTLFDYPSKNAFFEEIIWMLHRAKNAGS